MAGSGMTRSRDQAIESWRAAKCKRGGRKACDMPTFTKRITTRLGFANLAFFCSKQTRRSTHPSLLERTVEHEGRKERKA
jgi:hypothetical protein